jgi:hypothetical protein
VTSEPREPGEPSDRPRRLGVRPFDPLPRALLVPGAAVVDPEGALAALRSPGFDPSRVALLESGEPLQADAAWAGSPGRIAIRTRQPGRLALEATLPARGVLVLFDAFEVGWRASVDGGPAEVERADFAFRGLRLGAGTHRVELAYRPRGLREGAGLALAALLALPLALRRLRDAPRRGGPRESV